MKKPQTKSPSEMNNEELVMTAVMCILENYRTSKYERDLCDEMFKRIVSCDVGAEPYEAQQEKVLTGIGLVAKLLGEGKK